MPDPRVTIVVAAKDEASGVIKETENSVSGLGSSADKVTQSADRTTKSLGGMRAGVIGLSSGMFLGGEAFNSFNNQATKGAAALETARAAFHLFALAIIDPTPMGLAAVGIGLVVGALNAYATQQGEAQKKSADLIDSLNKLMEAETPLAKVIQAATGVTKDQAELFARAAKASDAVQDGMRKEDVLKQQAIEAGKTYTSVLNDMTAAVTEGKVSQEYADAFIEDFRLKAVAASKAAIDYGRSLAAGASAADDFNNRIEFFKKSLPEAATEITRFNTAIADLASNHKKAMDKIEADWNLAFKDSGENGTKAWDKAAKDIDRIERNLDENIVKQKNELTKTLGGIERDHVKQLASLADEQAKQLASLADEQVKITNDANKKIADAEKSRIEDLAKLDQDTGKSLRDATTEHEREALLEQRADKIAEIEQTASDKRAAAEEERSQQQADLAQRQAQAIAEFAQRKDLAEQDIAQRKELAQQETADRIAEMRTQADQQAADRRENRDDETKTINEALAKQLAAIATRKAEEEASYTAQKTKETSAHNLKMLDLLTYKTEAVKAAEAEKAVRDTVWNKYLSDLDNAKSGLAGMTIGGAPTWDWGKITALTGGAAGANFVVPPGFPGDSYPVMASSGERVAITPAGGQAPSRSIGEMNFYITSNDPTGVREEIRRYLENEAWVG